MKEDMDYKNVVEQIRSVGLLSVVAMLSTKYRPESKTQLDVQLKYSFFVGAVAMATLLNEIGYVTSDGSKKVKELQEDFDKFNEKISKD